MVLVMVNVFILGGNGLRTLAGQRGVRCGVPRLKSMGVPSRGFEISLLLDGLPQRL
jgi:hypothetical protein